MNESGEPELWPAPGIKEPIATVTQEEKAVVWFVLALSVFMSVSTAVMALVLAARPGHLKQPEVWSSGRYLLILVGLLSLTFICLPILAFFKMRQRKKRTGSIYRSGEELEAWRARLKKPDPLWRRITSTAIWGVGGIWFSYTAIVEQRHRTMNWVMAFLWLFIAGTYAFRTFPSVDSEKPKSVS